MLCPHSNTRSMWPSFMVLWSSSAANSVKYTLRRSFITIKDTHTRTNLRISNTNNYVIKKYMKDYTADHACRHPLMCHWRSARTISLDLLRRLVSEKSLEKYMKKYIEISPKITGFITKMQTFFYKHYCAKILCHPSFLPDLFQRVNLVIF